MVIFTFLTSSFLLGLVLSQIPDSGPQHPDKEFWEEHAGGSGMQCLREDGLC